MMGIPRCAAQIFVFIGVVMCSSALRQAPLSESQFIEVILQFQYLTNAVPCQARLTFWVSSERDVLTKKGFQSNFEQCLLL